MQLRVSLINFNENSIQENKKRIIKKIARKGTQIFRQEIRKRKLINTGNLINSIGAVIKKNGVTFDVNADYAEILNDGVKRHKMRYLVNAGPIPIVTKRKNKIFRVATNKNIKGKGHWTHPGFKRGKGFFDSSVNKIEKASREIVASEGLV